MKKGVGIVAGTQRRHQFSYTELMKRVQDGAIGEIVAGEAYWNGPCVRTYGFYHEPQPGWTGMETMLRNWYFYSWLSGDHIVEQHVRSGDGILASKSKGFTSQIKSYRANISTIEDSARARRSRARDSVRLCP